MAYFEERMAAAEQDLNDTYDRLRAAEEKYKDQMETLHTQKADHEAEVRKLQDEINHLADRAERIIQDYRENWEDAVAAMDRCFEEWETQMGRGPETDQ